MPKPAMNLNEGSVANGDADQAEKIKEIRPATFKGPKTIELTYSRVEFVQHILPYYAPCICLASLYIVYFTANGNLSWVLFSAYLINFPYFKRAAKTPQQEGNLDRNTERIFKADQRFLGPVYAYVLVDTLSWVWCLCVVSGVYPSFLPAWMFEDKITQTLGGWILFTFSWGYMAGVDGLAGHELIHKRHAFDKGLGMMTYTKILYSHFLLEHSAGHHRHVATPEDPATAKKGENFYTFAVKSAWGGHVATWQRETSRLQTKYDCEEVSLLTHLTENRMSWFAALHIALMGSIWAVFGKRAVLFQVCYALVGVFFIELINYTEHYGLLRKKDARGIYEPITEQHSWNAPSSPLLFRIQRHSDHHMHAYRPYQILRKIDNSPAMPYMYLYSMLIALCPPLWRMTMDQLLHNKERRGEGAVKAFFICFLVSLAYSTYSFV